MSSTSPKVASQLARFPSPTTGVHSKSGQDTGEGSGPSESTACRACRATKSNCDMEKPSCQRCRIHGIQCEYTEPSRAVSDDIFILVVGIRGAGKTSFINQCVGSQVLQAGHAPQSRIRSIAEAVFELDGEKIHLIDTPGFNVILLSDSGVWRAVTCWLASAYGVNPEVNGVVYMHRNSGSGMRNAALGRLPILSKLLKSEELSNFTLVTTMWDEVDQETGQLGELRLSPHFWKSLLEKGSSMYRHDGTRASALRIVSSLSSGKRVQLLQIRDSLHDAQTSSDLIRLWDGPKELESKLLEEHKDDKQLALRNNNMKSLRQTALQHYLESQIQSLDQDQNEMYIDHEILLEADTEDDEELHQLALKRARWPHSVEKRRSESKVQIEGPEVELGQGEIASKSSKMADLEDSTNPFSRVIESYESYSVLRQLRRQRREVHTSDSKDAADGFKSNLARNQNRSKASETGTSKREIRTRNAEIRPRQLRRRALHEERVALRAEIYRTSLHALRSRLLQYASADILGEQIHKELKTLEEDIGTPISSQSSGTVQNLDFDAQSPKFPIDKGFQDILFDENLREGLGTNADLISHWLYSRFWLCRNLGIVVYRNCCRLQTAHLADGFLSTLVPADSWPDRGPCVVNLRRIQIADIGALLDTLADCIRNIFNRGSHILSGQQDIQVLVECLYDIQARSGKLFASIDPMDPSENVSVDDLERELEEFYAEEPPQSSHLVSIFARCRCTFQALDLVLLAYEGAHVSDLEELTPDSADKRIILLNKGFPTSAEVTEIPTTCFRRLPMKCLAPLLGNRDVWVFTHTRLDCPPALYLKTDIETFADVWGPVWKVEDQHEPGKIARFNVGEGSIIPWPFDPVVHPALAMDERLCHWRSNFDFINYDASSIDIDSSSTSGEVGEAPTDDAISGRFDGSEVLVIGAELGPQLEWKPCRCSVYELMQQLKEAGRLNHMLASKSYRYVDSQQSSLVVGSHGIQAGRSKVFKDMKEEPLKKGLLAIWENEPELRDPREFENFWGVVVSLCTMNARRVRLVQLLGENSVACLLEGFQWSDLDAVKNSERRRSFLRAVCSADPSALGDLWDDNPSWREELGKALLICLRILSRTGYDENRGEFHMLWLPSGCRGPRRVTLRLTDQSWIRFLKDTTYSMTTAVIVEDSLGEGHPCRPNRSRWFRSPSVLETALCINRTLDPTPDLKKTRGCRDEADWISRTDARRWKHVWDVSGLARGEYLWVGSENRLKVLRPLSDWHLLLEVDIVKRALLREMMGMRPSERVSHWEYTDEEAEPIDIRPIPVHIL